MSRHGSLQLLSSMHPFTAAKLLGFFWKSCTALCFNDTVLTAHLKASNIAPPSLLSKEGEALLQRSSTPSTTAPRQRAGIGNGAAGGGEAASTVTIAKKAARWWWVAVVWMIDVDSGGK